MYCYYGIYLVPAIRFVAIDVIRCHVYEQTRIATSAILNRERSPIHPFNNYIRVFNEKLVLLCAKLNKSDLK